ncbi:MAG: hypothetical protein ACLFR1_07845 [Spirochaetia bacterium]
MKKYIIFCLLSIILIFSAAAVPEGIDLSIRFYNRQVYFPGSPVRISIEIANNSTETYRFKLSDMRVFNLDFEVRTLSNRAVSHAQNFIIERNTNQPVFFREIALEPGDRYSFIENMNDFVDIQQPGMYVVKAVFFPDLYQNNPDEQIESNQIMLSVRPEAATSMVAARIDEETGEILEAASLPPDEVVRYTLNARQRGQWQRFFLYLDLESLMLKNPDARRRYERLNEEGRRQMLREYRQDLQAQRMSNDILLIPTNFEIQQTVYTPEMGTVTVIERFAYDDYTEVKEYTYYLRRRDGIWEIYDYQVRNLGTE